MNSVLRQIIVIKTNQPTPAAPWEYGSPTSTIHEKGFKFGIAGVCVQRYGVKEGIGTMDFLWKVSEAAGNRVPKWPECSTMFEMVLDHRRDFSFLNGRECARNQK